MSVSVCVFEAKKETKLRDRGAGDRIKGESERK